MRHKMRAALGEVRPHLPAFMAIACLVFAVFAAVQWAVAAGLGLRSFVLGFAGGALALYLTVQRRPFAVP